MSEAALLRIATVGFLARLIISWISVGTNDSLLWHSFADSILKHGLAATYNTNPMAIHPVPAMYLVSSLLYLSNILDLPFPFLLRLPAICGEILIAYLIYTSFSTSDRKLGAYLTALFAWNPVSLLLVGFHGNTDGLCMSFLCLCFFFLGSKPKYIYAGLAFSLAISIKLIALVALPALIWNCLNFKAAKQLALGLTLGLIPYLLLCSTLSFEELLVPLSYRSIPSAWGVSYILRVAQVLTAPYLPLFEEFSKLYSQFSFIPILGSIAFFAACGKLSKDSPMQNLYFSFLVFMVLTPGFGVQYFEYLVPTLFFLHSSRSRLLSLPIALCLICIYTEHIYSWYPLFSLLGTKPLSATTQGVALAAWLLVSLELLRTIRIRDV